MAGDPRLSVPLQRKACMAGPSPTMTVSGRDRWYKARKRMAPALATGRSIHFPTRPGDLAPSEARM